MAGESKQPEVQPQRLINAADVILAHRQALATGTDEQRATGRKLLEQFTNTELMEAADFLRRLDMGPKHQRT